MLKKEVFRRLVGVLAVLGVVSIVVHLVTLVSIMSAAGIERGYEDDDKIGAIEIRKATARWPGVPQWFPDGERLTFSHEGVVYVIDLAGTRLQTIDGNDEGVVAHGPSVSPVGSRIAYAVYRESEGYANWEIVTARPDGSEPRRLTDNDRSYTHPVWSPDGTNLAFQSGRSEISVASVDGFDSRPLVSPLEEWSSVVGPPVFSPDGRHVAFVTNVFDSQCASKCVSTSRGHVRGEERRVGPKGGR